MNNTLKRIFMARENIGNKDSHDCKSTIGQDFQLLHIDTDNVINKIVSKPVIFWSDGMRKPYRTGNQQ